MAEVQPLSRNHDREAFDSGSEALDAFLKTTARQHQNRGISRTFVLVEPDSAAPNRIIGFFTLSACEGIASDSPLPPAPDPAKHRVCQPVKATWLSLS